MHKRHRILLTEINDSVWEQSDTPYIMHMNFKIQCLRHSNSSRSNQLYITNKLIKLIHKKHGILLSEVGGAIRHAIMQD